MDKRMRHCLPLLTALMLTSLLAGCGETPPERLKAGDALYDYYCIDCHTKKGLGPFLENHPAGKDALAPYEIVLMVKHGYDLGHTGMPSFPQLSDEQADAVAQFIYDRRPRQP
ncbi:cytochrome c [Marinobacterium sp. AK62]|uniref:Cytochrome c n=1 Tax=Marinobacterium alkalitolerans TaxID=1542925 RepID=A0ABS3Z8Y7_9GAMM|nr:cytochrome c [Marinobacterium alkalitolerans]MBP0048170.1 cytochrome c [Marinobacterium alkalitolerans]